MKDNDQNPARAAIFEVVENQIREQTPPETKATYERLIADGHSHEETMRLIGCVLLNEMNDILKEMEPFNLQRYVAALNALPDIPWDE